MSSTVLDDQIGSPERYYKYKIRVCVESTRWVVQPHTICQGWFILSRDMLNTSMICDIKAGKERPRVSTSQCTTIVEITS